MAKLLLDTNVWLEMLLQQEQAAAARDLLQVIPLADVAITDFSIHSIGIILTNGGKDDDFGKFVTDVLQDTPIAEVRLGLGDLTRLLDVRTRLHLDFDDAYQYVAAEKHNLTLWSASTPTSTARIAAERRRSRCWRNRPSRATGLRRSPAARASASPEP